MQLVLEIENGPMASRRLVVPYGETVTVGRERGDLVVAHDARMSAKHFSVEWTDSGIWLSDAGTAGTYVDDDRIYEAPLEIGSVVRAGGTTFTVRSLPDAEPLPKARRRVDSPPPALSFLREQDAPLFAVVDAARDVRVLELLRTRPCEADVLFEGEEGERLADVAPYLVHMPPDSEILERFVVEGWGNAWGIYLTSDRPMAAVLRHLRKLLVATIGDGQRVLFRFYDPRVLRAFLPACNVRQISEMFGDVRTYVVEGEAPGAALRYRAGERDLATEVLALEKTA